MYYGSYSLVVWPVNSQRRSSSPNLDNYYSYSDIQDINCMCNIGYNGSILFKNGTFKGTCSNVNVVRVTLAGFKSGFTLIGINEIDLFLDWKF